MLSLIKLVVQQCAARGVACFVKQLGANPTCGNGVFQRTFKHKKAGDPAEWPEELMVRQYPAGLPDPT